MSLLRIGATNIAELSDLRNRIALTYPQDAVVTVTLYDAQGAAVPNATNIACPWVAAVGGLPGIYRAVLPSTLLLTSQTYTAKFVATTAGAVGVFPELCVAA